MKLKRAHLKRYGQLLSIFLSRENHELVEGSYERRLLGESVCIEIRILSDESPGPKVVAYLSNESVMNSIVPVVVELRR
ncbi:hypothetical protein SAMN02745181_0344 [Rubritalea squalenifaciens DSM 18772]|uniref:Uncharacterized protein n=1 Tax=Rubritalea squalenifaciens DSM 18772 TaxID=1123071 RepID=A0A1M6BYU1_9BACT|nr:hypothetical protein [Rubritalea squalenifaciens]SHI53910.1 hypothetical protein SAMN02745181_0344 [Rubritalea squalenifaciens DSM 18772]